MSSRRRSVGTLSARLSLVMLAVLGGATICVLFIKHWSDRRWAAELQYQLNAEVAAHIAESDHFFEDGAIRIDAAKHVFMQAMVVNPSLEIYLLDAQGEILAFDAPEGLVLRRRVDLAPIRAALSGKPLGPIMGDDPRSADGHKPIGVAPVQEADGDGYVYVVLGGQFYDAIAADLFERSSARWGIGLILLSFLVAGVVGYLSLRVLVRPLERLRNGIAGFQRGERVQLSAGHDEIGELARDFQRMARRIRAQMSELASKDEQRRSFVANISHDLRTPAAAVLGYLELLGTGYDHLAPEEARAYLESAVRQAERLSRLVDQLFELARLEVAEEPPQLEAFSSAELVQDITCKFEHSAGARGVRFGASFPKDLPDVHADIGLVERALDNLIENAIRHSPPEGCVRVRLSRTADGVELSVEDDGPGIAAADLPRLQERHYRGRGEPLGADGLGIGLAITRRIALLHGSELVIESEEGSGARFSFVLPAEARQAPRKRHRKVTAP